jgi:predicted membrane protein
MNTNPDNKGKKKLMIRRLPVQAQAVLLAGAILIAFIVLQMLRSEKQAFNAGNALVLGAFVLSIAVSTYNIDCLISGNCRNWATFHAVAYVVSQGIVVSQLRMFNNTAG